MFNKIDFDEFADCLRGLIDSPLVLEMKNIEQHVHDVSCYEHCLYVALVSYAMAKRTGRDFRAAARGAMLHDLYLINWDEEQVGLFERLVLHPKIAFDNAMQFGLSQTEGDIIINHMWPLTPTLPKTAEGKLVSLADKICAAAEMLGFPAPILLAKRMESYMQGPCNQEALAK